MVILALAVSAEPNARGPDIRCRERRRKRECLPPLKRTHSHRDWDVNNTHYQGVVSCRSLNDALSYQVLHARLRPKWWASLIHDPKYQGSSVALAQTYWSC